MIISSEIINQRIIENEKTVLNNILTQQKQLKQTLAIFLEKLSNSIYNANNISDSSTIISLLDGINKCFDNIREDINQILELKKYLCSFSLSTYDFVFFENYNKRYLQIFQKIMQNNSFYYSFIESLSKYIEINLSESTSTNTQTLNNSIEPQNTTTLIDNNKDNKTNINVLNYNIPERTLYILSSYKTAILPYSINELEKYFTNNPEDYSSIQDIIDKKYTISLNHLKNTTISRFKETYNLARKKSNFSKLKSLRLASRLLFKSKVEPIIIKSCKNISELYIYLNCLDDDQIDEFKCFKIVYDN